MSNKQILLRGAGRLKVAQYDPAGFLGGYRFVGNVPMLKLEPKVTLVEHREDQTGYRFKDLRITDTSDLSVSFTLENASIDNFSMGFFGDISSESGTGTFTSTISGPIVAGLDYKFGKPGSTITTATGPSLIAASDYIVNKDGTATFKADIAGDVAVAGNKAKSTSTTILTRQTPQIALLFEGLNTANNRSSVIVDLPRIGLNPAKGYDLVGNTIAKMDMDGDAIYDPNSVAEGVLAGYGTITLA
ncbi:MAG: hypothetical protein M3Y65_24875 [Pseudomonadota bacterium]|nr:hypothetical protein [Pseudomonadota bacterium]